jgi:hypothetical protein
MVLSCATTQIPPKPPVITPNDVIITCVHKYDSERVVKYVKGNTQLETMYGEPTHAFFDINGNWVYLSVPELENYNCTNNKEIP